jgi:hypothetical protein
LGQATPGAAGLIRSFTRFACIDWSGAAGERQRGIAVAVCVAGNAAPRLVERQRGWSRREVLDWLLAERDADMLIGFDFSFALPFPYFPGWTDSPAKARDLWALVDRLAANDPHLGVAGLVDHPEASRHFRRHGGRTGDRFGSGSGRLRATETRCRALGLGPAQSGFNLVGPAQVGKASLAGMRLLHRLEGAIPVWPFDPLPARGAAIVEVYTSLAARAAGRPPGHSKLRTRADLATALAAFDSDCSADLTPPDEHAADALLAAAWLRRTATDPALWTPPIPASDRDTEGWTFGVT